MLILGSRAFQVKIEVIVKAKVTVGIRLRSRRANFDLDFDFLPDTSKQKNMIFAIGSSVKFIYTGDEGVVTELLEHNMINVRLEDGEIIPAFEEDIVRMEDYKKIMQDKPPVKAKSVPGKKPKQIKEPDRPDIKQQYAILKSMGIQVAFEGQQRSDERIDKYLIYLINDTRYSAIFTFTLSSHGKTPRTVNGKIESVSTHSLGELTFEQLSESAVFQLDCWQLTTAGSGPKLSKSIKLKPQQFFKKNMTAPLLNKQVHLYVVFENFDPGAKPKTDEGLQAYTKRKAAENVKPVKSNFKKFNSFNTQDFAEFNNELDLHIEKLTDKSKGMRNADMLHLQMRRFQDYMDQAIRLGVPKVYIIHGVGKGRLKNDIHRWLEDNAYVVKFKNEFHQRFGYGATEVDL